MCDIVCKRKYKLPSSNQSTVDSGYFEFDGIVKKIRVNRTSTQEELRKYRKCSLFNDERLGPYLVWSTFACPAIPPGLGPGPSPDTHVTVNYRNSIIRRHSERHVRSEKISPFITTVN